MKEAPAVVVCKCVYFGECLARMLDVSQSLRGEIVVGGESSLRYLKGFTEIAFVSFFSLGDLVSPVVRWKIMCDRLEHSPLILGANCCFL